MISISPIASTSQTAVVAGRSATRGGSPGQGQDVPNAERVGAQQLRLERHQVAVAGGQMDQALQAELLLDAERHRHGAHADSTGGGVADVDEVDAGLLEQAGGLDGPVDADRPRRVDLDRDDE